ncbi:MAG: LamG domain-containing protein [Candidatus Micrarchaeota archaeon]|nr:LamG domain-containing protein [Candidatus Micrarchaeota archaeon]MDE1824166.1 LamG domain-containing protein [Candidatus Micrarchaeota archaeon]MDE1849415.1 LamG domain-containing protein [Candidatus Micrarchaeota archaeon]
MKSSRHARLQSAMEYLMTYGWAILAIAIVMVSLYSLGIFNLSNLAPTATPGSCQVLKTSAQTSLAGQCNNLVPKYVARFNSNNLGTVSFPYNNFPTGDAARSLSAWVYQPSITGSAAQRYDIFGYGANGWCFALTLNQLSDGSAAPGKFGFAPCEATGSTSTATLSSNVWYNIVETFDGSTLNFYVNGVNYGSASYTLHTVISSASIGMVAGSGSAYNGSVANAQVYNTSLSASDVKTLYKEGIGGAPIELQYLVGWWPLNGNSNDYSGNYNQGTPTNVIWSASWQAGYAAPTS